MEIQYLGHSSFRLKGKEVTVITDPYKDQHLGFKFPKTEADIVTVSHSHQDHNAPELVEGNPFVISGAGEYEIKGVSVFGVQSFHDDQEGEERGKNIIYVFDIEGVKICHLGDLGEELSEAQLEEMGQVDILMVPVGGTVALNAKQANEAVVKIDPWIVIPMHYKAPGMGQEFNWLAPVEDFLKEMGLSELQAQPKLSVTKDKLPSERQIVLLERKS